MTKNVTISEEAYNALKRRKLQAESFSDAVLRLAKTMPRLSDVFLLYPELKGCREFADAVSHLRESIDKSL